MQTDDRKYRAIRNLPYHKPQLAAVAEPVVSGWANYASWLSDDILLIVGWFHAEEDSSIEASLVFDNQYVPLEVRCLSYRRPDLQGADTHAGKILTARFLSPKDTRGPLGSLIVQTGTTSFALGPLDISRAMTDLQILVRSSLMWLDPRTRAEIMEFLTLALKEHRGTTDGLRLSKNLFVVREMLIERLTSAIIERDKPQGLNVEHILVIDEKLFLIKGWMRDAEAKVSQLTAVSPEGARVELLKEIFCYPRPDVEEFYAGTLNTSDELLTKNGFLALFETSAPSYLSAGWKIEMRNAVGTAVEVTAPPVIQDPIAVRNSILEGLPLESLPNETLMAYYVFPALSRLQEKLQGRVEVESVVQYGIPNESPDVSIIVPLYKRIDFLEQQLAQFVHDPEIRVADLIYVLDSPELANTLRNYAAQLFELYRVPFRVVTLKRNAGFSGANNVGISFAHGRLLLLLNSDILPDKPGWLGTMTQFYDSTAGIGALGPKLLYEDDSLQHAGMYFYLPSSTALANIWQNMHYFKGFHRYLPAANVSRPVPAVTGACLMIDKNLYSRVGGFRDIYLQGDHEDSDLCLRLIEAGYENWYLPDVELYHLEAQSYPSTLRGLTALYNRWLHTRLWNERIEAVMAKYALSTVDRAAVTDNERQRLHPAIALELGPEQERMGKSLADTNLATKKQSARDKNYLTGPDKYGRANLAAEEDAGSGSV